MPNQEAFSFFMSIYKRMCQVYCHNIKVVCAPDVL